MFNTLSQEQANAFNKNYNHPRSDDTDEMKMKKIFQFLISKTFWKHIGLMAAVAILVIFLVNVWLKQYTHHSQKLELPDFVEMTLNEAQRYASENKFELIVLDSVHIVGKHGSIVLNQNPEPGFHVKEGRKIYVTVTKHNADMISIKSLPVLYGKNYERKKRELAIGHEINSTIVGSMYDVGPEGHIMMVIFENDTIITRRKRVKNLEIPRGGSLKFVISKQSGGLVDIPDLVCQSYDAAKFLLSGYRLKAGETNADATVEDFSAAVVYKQDPAFSPGAKVSMGTAFTLFLTQEPPSNCE